VGVVDLGSLRDAYSLVSEQYIRLFDGVDKAHDDDAAFIEMHLAGLPGPVLDLGCGPGHWTGYLHSLGADVTGVDIVPEFIAHAQMAHPGPEFRLGSMTEAECPEHPLAGILSWYSTIHLPPADLGRVLADFRRFLAVSGVLVVGFFDSDEGVDEFDHQVIAAHRWPIHVFAESLAQAGFVEVGRLQQQFPDRPDRKYAAIAARAV